jgi:hypothetical protein
MPRRKQSISRRPASVTNDYRAYCLKQMPKGAIKADLTKHAPHNSYGPPMWYVDEHHKCVECRKEFNFTAREQQYWFEVLQIPIQVFANRCAACRKKRRTEISARKRHMAEMAKRPPHPNEAFFRKKAR